MISATDLKNGITFEMDGKPYLVTKYELQKIARGGGTVKLALRNLQNGFFETKTMNSTYKVDEISTLKRKLQYLYKDADNAVFMDGRTYDQVEIPLEIIGDNISFIKEGEEVNVLFWNDKALSVDIPPNVVLKVSQTDPGVKGNSATNVYKPAKLENGLEVKVPLFIKVGDQIRVDTRSSSYVERVN